MSAKKRDDDVDKFALCEVIPATRHFIRLDRERCTGCGCCEAVCPMDLWKIDEGKAALARDYRKKCAECGSCFVACEEGVIDFTYPPGGTGVVFKYS